jgi:hypothetical protein
MPLWSRSSLSGDVLSLGYFNGDAVDGGVTLVVVAEDAVWFWGYMAASSFELDACENELTLGVGGVNINGSSFALLLLDTVSSITEESSV